MIWPFKMKDDDYRFAGLAQGDMCLIEMGKKHTYLPLRKVKDDVLDRILIVPDSHVWIEPFNEPLSDDELKEIMEFVPEILQRRYRRDGMKVEAKFGELD